MTDVAIAGGGLIGLAIAWRCAQRGLSVVVADDAPGSGASYAAAGMLAPVAEAAYGEQALLRLCRESLHRFPAFAAEVELASGVEVGLRTAGTLVVGFDADDMRELDALHAYQRELGLPAARLTASEARRREPSLTPRLRGAVHVPGDHSVDARALHVGLLAAAETAGVRLVRAKVEEITVDGGRATGVRLSDGGPGSSRQTGPPMPRGATAPLGDDNAGSRCEVDTRLTADTVVLALGAGSGCLPGAPALPVRPVKGQILRLAGADGLLTATVRALVRGRPVYLVPSPGGGLIVGATVEDKGFDTCVTAGAVHDLLSDAIEVVPGVTELELRETLTRWRPGTADNAPLLGPSGLPGLVLATGHYRNGVLLTPVTADLITDLLVSGTLPELAADFRADRFLR